MLIFFLFIEVNVAYKLKSVKANNNVNKRFHFIKSKEEYISKLKTILYDDYFEGVEISQMPFEGLMDEVVSLIKSAHMDYTYCGHSRLFKNKLNINSLDESERLKAVEELKKGIDEAHTIGAKEFQFLSRTYDKNKIAEHIAALAKSTRDLCEYAKNFDINVTLEIFDHTIDKCSLLGPIDRVTAFLEQVKDIDNFGFMCDLSHIPMIGETIEENLTPIRDYIKHAHIGNTSIKDKNDVAYGDMHPRFGYEKGENDTAELTIFLQHLKDFGYLKEGGNNFLGFEVRPLPGEDERIVIANAKRCLNKAWRLVH